MDNALLSIGREDGKFVYVNGNLSFQMGPTETVTIATGLSTNLGPLHKLAVKAEFTLKNLLGSNARLSDDVQTIEDVQVSTLQVCAVQVGLRQVNARQVGARHPHTPQVWGCGLILLAPVVPDLRVPTSRCATEEI